MNTSLRPLGVLIVDDQAFFCQMTRQLLSHCPEFSVVGETYDVQRALDLIDEVKPDVILMDVEMEGTNGLEATYLIRSRFPDIRVVLMSVYDDKEYSYLASKVGALAFIPKKDFSAPALAQVLNSEAVGTGDS